MTDTTFTKCKFYNSSRKDNTLVETSTFFKEEILEGQYDRAKVRMNVSGKLISLTYSKLAYIKIVKAEDFLISSNSNETYLQVRLYGNPFTTSFDRDWDSSQIGHWRENSPAGKFNKDVIKKVGYRYTPAELVKYALDKKVTGIYFTGGEPSVNLEYVLDVAKLTKEKNLTTAITTNGSFHPDRIEEVSTLVDKFVIKLHSYADDFYVKHCHSNIDPVLDNIYYLSRSEADLEYLTTIIPKETDTQEFVRNMARLMFKYTQNPIWQIHYFYPEYRVLDKPRTPQDAMESIAQYAKEAGVSQCKIF